MKPILALFFALSATTTSADYVLETRNTDNGAAQYAEHCASCHGANLEGQDNWEYPFDDGSMPAPPHDETGHTWHHATGFLLEYIRDGGAATMEAAGISKYNSKMPAFGHALTEDDILDILGFIYQSWPEEARRVQRDRSLSQ